MIMRRFLCSLLFVVSFLEVRGENTVTVTAVWGGNVYARACIDIPTPRPSCGWQIELQFSPIVTSLVVYDGRNVGRINSKWYVANKNYNGVLSATNLPQLCLLFTGYNNEITYPANPNITARFVCTCTSATGSSCSALSATSSTTTTTTLATSTTATTTTLPTTTTEAVTHTPTRINTKFRLFKKNYKIYTSVAERDNRYVRCFDRIDCALRCSQDLKCVAFSFMDRECLLVDSPTCIPLESMYPRPSWETWLRNGTSVGSC